MRKKFISIRFSKEELAQVRDEAKRHGLGIATYLRQTALDERPEGEDLSDVIQELSQQGELLKHLHNEEHRDDEQIENLLSDMGNTIRKIDIAIC